MLLFLPAKVNSYCRRRRRRRPCFSYHPRPGAGHRSGVAARAWAVGRRRGAPHRPAGVSAVADRLVKGLALAGVVSRWRGVTVCFRVWSVLIAPLPPVSVAGFLGPNRCLEASLNGPTARVPTSGKDIFGSPTNGRPWAGEGFGATVVEVTDLPPKHGNEKQVVARTASQCQSGCM
jgi:hypothetical protein